jgi:hypothetical protein
MAVTTATTVDIASVLEQLLNEVEGLRAYRYISDAARVPCAIVSLPTITWNDPDSAFCSSSWAFGVSLVVSRANDRASQDALSRMVSEVAQVLDGAEVDGLFSVEMQTAVPTTITMSGVESPAYNLSVLIRA